MLRLTNLTLRAGTFEARDVMLNVAPAEYFVLMGPTGSGKSLLAKAVCGLIRPAAGRVEIDGRDVTALEPRRRRVGYVPQDSGLFPHQTVEANITFGLRVAGLSRRRALRRAAGVIDTLGLEPLLKRATVNLSGGERQKTALARALAREPRLLVLDEPVSSLDEPARRDICRMLRRVREEFGVTTLHVCHSREEAHLLADRVGVLVGGRLLQAGPMSELLTDPADPAVRELLAPPSDGPTGA